MAGNGLVRRDLIYKLPHRHLIRWIITEDTNINFIAKALSFKDLWLLYMDAQVVQTLLYISHIVPPLRKIVERRKNNIIIIAFDSVFQNGIKPNRI